MATSESLTEERFRKVVRSLQDQNIPVDGVDRTPIGLSRLRDAATTMWLEACGFDAAAHRKHVEKIVRSLIPPENADTAAPDLVLEVYRHLIMRSMEPFSRSDCPAEVWRSPKDGAFINFVYFLLGTCFWIGQLSDTMVTSLTAPARPTGPAPIPPRLAASQLPNLADDEITSKMDYLHAVSEAQQVRAQVFAVANEIKRMWPNASQAEHPLMPCADGDGDGETIFNILSQKWRDEYVKKREAEAQTAVEQIKEAEAAAAAAVAAAAATRAAVSAARARAGAAEADVPASAPSLREVNEQIEELHSEIARARSFDATVADENARLGTQSQAVRARQAAVVAATTVLSATAVARGAALAAHDALTSDAQELERLTLSREHDQALIGQASARAEAAAAAAAARRAEAAAAREEEAAAVAALEAELAELRRKREALADDHANEENLLREYQRDRLPALREKVQRERSSLLDAERMNKEIRHATELLAHDLQATDRVLQILRNAHSFCSQQMLAHTVVGLVEKTDTTTIEETNQI